MISNSQSIRESLLPEFTDKELNSDINALVSKIEQLTEALRQKTQEVNTLLKDFEMEQLKRRTLEKQVISYEQQLAFISDSNDQNIKVFQLKLQISKLQNQLLESSNMTINNLTQFKFELRDQKYECSKLRSQLQILREDAFQQIQQIKEEIKYIKEKIKINLTPINIELENLDQGEVLKQNYRFNKYFEIQNQINYTQASINKFMASLGSSTVN